MTMPRNAFIAPHYCWHCCWLSAAGIAQEAAEDDLLPAVDTSAVAPGASKTLPPPASADAAAVRRGNARARRAAEVMDTIELGRTEITGNQELPKVLYIVPWKKSDPGDLMGKPVNSLLDEVLAPIDREEFIRQVDYYGDLYGEEVQE